MTYKLRNLDDSREGSPSSDTPRYSQDLHIAEHGLMSFCDRERGERVGSSRLTCGVDEEIRRFVYDGHISKGELKSSCDSQSVEYQADQDGFSFVNAFESRRLWCLRAQTPK